MFVNIIACLVLSSVLFSASADDTVLESGQNYIVQKVEDANFKLEKGVFYKWTEIDPTNQTFPEDHGGNFGDLGFHNYPDEELLGRDTILNEKFYNQTVIITYRRKFDGHKTTGIMSLNFGRQRGYTQQVGIGLESGTSLAMIWVAPFTQIRVFVETYGYKLN